MNTSELPQLLNSHLKELVSFPPKNNIFSSQVNLEDYIHLNCNENPYGFSPLVSSSIKDRLNTGNRYPKYDKSILKDLITKKNNLESADCIHLSNGSDKILLLIAQLFANFRSEIIFPEYSFMAFNTVCKAIGAKAVVTPTLNWKIDIKAILDAINSQTKIIFLANPNNPTGVWLDYNTLREFVSQVPDNVIITIDEAYYEYAHYHLGESYPNVVELQKLHPNIIITRTFSKIYGLAGFRIGYCILHPFFAQVMDAIDFPYCITKVASLAAVAALNDDKHIKASLEKNFTEMSILKKSFTDMNLSFLSSPANFIALNVGEKAPIIYKKLLEKKILVCPLDSYKLPNFLRISIGTSEENKFFLNFLKNIINELYGREFYGSVAIISAVR